MSGPAVPLTNMGNGYTIVTHVITPPTGSSGTQQNGSSASPLQKFLKGEPKALGTVQLMIGVLMFLFGIVITVHVQPVITVYSGICFWGSLLYIATGSLAVSASNKLHRCVVNGALITNVFSSITAAIAIILLSLDLAIIRPSCYYDYDGYRCSPRVGSSGIAGVLLVFSVLQFIISVFITGFSCRATCNNEPMVNITVVPNLEGGSSLLNPFPTQNNQQWVYGVSGATASAPMERPPEYTETKCPPDNEAKQLSDD